MAAHGIGTAHGLRAIGWFFAYGPVIYCPAHHPHGIAAAHRQAHELVNADGWRPCGDLPGDARTDGVG